MFVSPRRGGRWVGRSREARESGDARQDHEPDDQEYYEDQETFHASIILGLARQDELGCDGGRGANQEAKGKNGSFSPLNLRVVDFELLNKTED